MLSPNQVSSSIEEIGYSSMRGYESLSLPRGLEPSHPTLPHCGRFTRLLCPVIGIPVCDMNGLRHHLAMNYEAANYRRRAARVSWV